MIPKTMDTADLHGARVSQSFLSPFYIATSLFLMLCPLIIISSQLVQLQFNKEGPPIEEVDVFTGEEVLRDNAGPRGSLCFVVRRPG
jgi:hypothetical protein